MTELKHQRGSDCECDGEYVCPMHDASASEDCDDIPLAKIVKPEIDFGRIGSLVDTRILDKVKERILTATKPS